MSDRHDAPRHIIDWVLPIAFVLAGCGDPPVAEQAHASETSGDAAPVAAVVAEPAPAAATVTEPSPDQIVVWANATEFKPCPPNLPPGCQMAVMEGNPASPELFAMRFSAPKGFQVPPHYHLRPERVTIISGKVGVGFGDVLDKTKGRIFGAGDFYINAPHAHHFVWVEQDAVLQINGVGPWQTIALDAPRPEAVASAVPEPDFPAGRDQIVVSASETAFKPCPPNLPAGCEIAVMEGDPAEAKLFSLRFRVGAGFEMPPHHHPAPERVTIISGKVGVGFGDTADRSVGKVFGAGDFYVNRAGANHFVWAETPAVLQINGLGPWQVIAAEAPSH